jgi:carbon storage regulator
VHREEIYKELQSANAEAASPSDDAVRALTRMLRPKPEKAAPGPTPE